MSENIIERITKGISNYKESFSDGTSEGLAVAKAVMYAAAVGAIFPILAWSYEYFFSINEFKGIWQMHINNPLHFIIDSAPLVAGFIVYGLYLYLDSDNRKLQKLLEERNASIRSNQELAVKIVQGDFDIKPESLNKSDKLNSTLMLLLKNLRVTSVREKEQSWITKGREVVSDILRQQNNINDLAFNTLVGLVEYTEAVQSAFYTYDEEKDVLINRATLAYGRKKFIKQEFKIGQGLAGQAAFEKKLIYRTEVPDDYVTISSGILGDKKPNSILVVPLMSNEQLQGVIELAAIAGKMQSKTIRLIDELSGIIAQTLFNLKINNRTEDLLAESRKLTDNLKANEEVLRRNAKEMKHTQLELQRSNRSLEAQFAEVEKGQKRMHSLLENASEVISIYDEDGIVKYVSPSVKNILGFEVEEMMGRNKFTRGDAIIQTSFKELLQNPQKVSTFEYRYEKKDRRVVWLETTGRNLISNPAIGGIIFNTRDITVRKVAEEAQKMSGEMQALSENAPDMIVRFNTERKFFYANPVVERLLGISRTGLKQKRLGEVKISSEIETFFNEGIEKVMFTPRKYELEKTLPTVEGDKIMQINVIPEFNSNDEVETILFVAHDITDRKLIEIEIEKKNKAITESINYAQRIQSAIIPDTEYIKKFIPKSFIFYKPRDVVSGDFPWFYAHKEHLYIAAVDCTGHGVPGALLSFIGYFLLNSIVDHDRVYDAGEVLDKLHEGVRRTLRQDEGAGSARDGMDIALCRINYSKKELQYSGAHRPLYYVSNDKLEQFKGNSKAIGGIPPRRRKEADFKTHTINYKPGDRFYFFSDGLPDQIGGGAGRKYQAKRIRDAVQKYQTRSIENIGRFFVEDFDEWKGEQKQIDDVLLIGMEL